MTFVEALDLEYWLVNTFSGSFEIFIFLALIVISALAARFRMPAGLALMFMGLFGVILGSYFGGIYMVIVIIASMVTFILISRTVKV